MPMSNQGGIWSEHLAQEGDVDGRNRGALAIFLALSVSLDLPLALLLPQTTANIGYVVAFVGLALLVTLSGESYRWHAGIGYAVLLAAAAIASLLANVDSGDADATARYTLMLLACLGACVLNARLLADPLQAVFFVRALALFGALSLLFYLVSFAAEIRLGIERFGGVLNPNAVGLVAMSVGTLALSLPLVLRLPAVTVVLFALYAVNSRAAIVAFFVGVGVAYMVNWKHRAPRWRLLGVLSLMFGIVALAYLDPVRDFVLDDIFKFDDPYRGIDTGFTNRTDAWLDAIGLWLEAPLLGFGYRAQELLFSDISSFSSSHSGYLSLLIDGGALALVLFLVFAGHAVARCVRQVRQVPQLSGFLAFLVGYLVNMTFERFALNFGNMASLMFALLAISIFAVELGAPAWQADLSASKQRKSGPLFANSPAGGR